MKNSKWITGREMVVFAGLLILAVVLRIEFRYIPNFAPIAALAMFAGFYFRHIHVAVALPLLAMLISDIWIGSYHIGIMTTVYASLALPAFFRGAVRTAYGQTVTGDKLASRFAAGLTLGGIGLAGAVCFFVCTNLAVWYFSEFYQNTLPDLVRCFTNALPFFRYSVVGDLGFGWALFGGHALAMNLIKAAEIELPLVTKSH